MKYLLDTHIFLWFLNGAADLPENTVELIADTNNECFLSIVSLWEIAIKLSLGKLEMAISFDDLKDYLKTTEIELLSIDLTDISAVRILEFHHRDPFDRMIIAQSKNRGIPVLTKDESFKKYGISLIDVN